MQGSRKRRRDLDWPEAIASPWYPTDDGLDDFASDGASRGRTAAEAVAAAEVAEAAVAGEGTDPGGASDDAIDDIPSAMLAALKPLILAGEVYSVVLDQQERQWKVEELLGALEI